MGRRKGAGKASQQHNEDVHEDVAAAADVVSPEQPVPAAAAASQQEQTVSAGPAAPSSAPAVSTVVEAETVEDQRAESAATQEAQAAMQEKEQEAPRKQEEQEEKKELEKKQQALAAAEQKEANNAKKKRQQQQQAEEKQQQQQQAEKNRKQRQEQEQEQAAAKKQQEEKKQPPQTEASSSSADAAAAIAVASAPPSVPPAASSKSSPPQEPPAIITGAPREETSLMGALRADVYDYFIAKMTSHWYRCFLKLLQPGSTVLDVGIGTATSLVANKDVIVERRLRIVGVDYDAHYVTAAGHNIRAAGLEKNISVICASIHDYTPAPSLGSATPFDAVYFSGSFMIIPNKVEALRRCQSFLNPSTGRFYFTQSFEHRGYVGSFVNSFVKPALKMVTTIDFGQVTYRDDFDKTIKEAKMQVEKFDVLSAGHFRDECLVVAK